MQISKLQLEKMPKTFLSSYLVDGETEAAYYSYMLMIVNGLALSIKYTVNVSIYSHTTSIPYPSKITGKHYNVCQPFSYFQFHSHFPFQVS